MMEEDHIPVRDTSNNAKNPGHLMNDQKAAQQRRLVSKWDRDELEDKYLRLHEDYISLKKHGRKQEDMIKRMATKLLRLAKDKKKQEGEGKGETSLSAETEEQMLELQSRCQSLEKFNTQLKEKMMLLKQQLQSSGRPAAYSHVQSRISTGIPKHQTMADPRLTKNLRVIGPAPHELPKRVTSPPFSHAGHHLIEQTRAEKRMLENDFQQLQEQLNEYEMEIEQLKEKIRLQDAEHENELIKLKTQVTADKRHVVQENIDLIKLQREVKEKSTHLIALQEKYSALEDNTYVLRQNHDQILMEMERLNVQVKEEQNQTLTLKNQLKMASGERRHITELKEQVIDLQREIDTLKEANEKLVASAFDLEREKEWAQRENKLKVQIAQLEATLNADLGEKGGIITKYARLHEEHDKLEQEHRELRITHFQMKEQFDDMNEKLKFFTKESLIDLTELEDALVLVKQKKQKATPAPDFLQMVDTEFEKDHKRHLLELQAEYAEIVHELEKTRNMLVVQHRINKDYQREAETAHQQLQETKKEYELKLDEYARLLDIRAARIKKLELQLRDVAYGTRQYRISPPDDDADSMADLDETLQLERGQNLFEIHIQKVSLSEDAVRHIGDEEPSVFCTWEFFEFEMQSTPVVRGSRPVFDFTSQYIVRVDDFFLHYLQKQSCTMELHQTFGQDYRTVAACQMVFRDIFDKPAGRIHGLATLTGVTEGETGVGYGTVEYWVRLRVPMDQALRLYKERTKALGYLMANDRQTKDDLKALDEDAAKRPLDNVNELHIKIIKCSKVKARRPDVQPSPYCVYQFFEFSDHDTVIVRNSSNPEFHDHKTYPVPMTQDLHMYLCNAHLNIFVFDDADPEVESFIGKAAIPLMVLVNLKEPSLKGTFPLVRTSAEGGDDQPDREQNLGTIDVELYWQYPYVKPSHTKTAPLQMDSSGEDKPERLPRGHSPPRSTLRKPGPSAHSTPMPQDKMAAIESQIINRVPVDSVASPKPASRRRVQLRASSTEGGGDGGDLVNDTVSRVVGDFMPASHSISSVTEMSTIRSGEIDKAVQIPKGRQKVPPSVLVAPPGPIVPGADRYSTEEEELEQRPTPLRQSLNIESGSASEEGDTWFIETVTLPPKPKARTRVEWKPEKITRPEAAKQSPVRQTQSLEDDEESVEEEIEEERETPTHTPTSPASPAFPRQPSLSSHTSEISEDSEPQHIESDSEGVMAPAPRPKARMPKPSDHVTIVVASLTLENDSDVMKNPDVKQLFVEYYFQGLPAEETETPFSLPKPAPDMPITFNFSKNIAVDMEKHYERRQWLAGMLLPDDPMQGRLKFTVVSEPEDAEGDCEEVGVAYVSLRDILKNNKDVKEQDIDIVSPKGNKMVIGQLNVSVECLAALRAIDQEMQVDGTY